MRTPFFGPAYVSGSTNLADQQCLNLYPEVVETRTGKDVGAFFSVPGLDFIATVGPGPIRALQLVGPYIYIVSGQHCYSFLYPNFTSLGTLTTSTGPVSIVGNVIGLLTQVAFFDGVAGWIATNSGSGGAVGSISVISLPLLPGGTSGPPMGIYQDTFGLICQGGTNYIYQSNPGDLSTWNALNYDSADSTIDPVVALVSFHREIWVFKQYHTEIWVDAGLSGFAFQRLDGPYIESGCVAPFSVSIGGEILFWLSQNEQGEAAAVMASSYQPQPISTQVLTALWQTYSTITDALGWCYQQNGHLFYVLTFPTAGATWVYDATVSQQLGYPCWHQRGVLNTDGTIGRHWGNAFAYAGLGTYSPGGSQACILGDYRNGNLYQIDPATLTDNGTNRKWLRSWRALPKPTFDPVKFSSLQIDMQTGVDVPSGSSPNVSLSWSDDGGNTWSPPLVAPAGQLGQTALRVKFNALGSTRRSTGLDRIFQLSSTDAFGVCLIGADLQ